jgi:hypothetical protein
MAIVDLTESQQALLFKQLRKENPALNTVAYDQFFDLVNAVAVGDVGYVNLIGKQGYNDEGLIGKLPITFNRFDFDFKNINPTIELFRPINTKEALPILDAKYGLKINEDHIFTDNIAIDATDITLRFRDAPVLYIQDTLPLKLVRLTKPVEPIDLTTYFTGNVLSGFNYTPNLYLSKLSKWWYIEWVVGADYLKTLVSGGAYDPALLAEIITVADGTNEWVAENNKTATYNVWGSYIVDNGLAEPDAPGGNKLTIAVNPEYVNIPNIVLNDYLITIYY